MPREGSQYRITETWQDLVRERMKDRGIRSVSALAKKVGIGRSAMWQAMQPGAVQTGWMPEINRALGLDAPINEPTGATTSKPEANLEPADAELLSYFHRLSELDRGRELENMRRRVEDAEQRANVTPRKTP